MAGSGVNVKDSTSYGNYYNSTLTANGLYAEHIRELGKTDTSLNAWTAIATNYGNGSITLGREKIDETDEITKYKYKEIATGTAEGTKVKNIYDMAGNMWEWTTEIGRGVSKYFAGFSVLRGCGYSHNGNDYPISYRNGSSSANDSAWNIGFRVILYVK